MKIIFFAQSREAAGCGESELALDRPITNEELWKRLLEMFPQLRDLQKTARLARNETYLTGVELLEPGDEVAVIPAVSGG